MQAPNPIEAALSRLMPPALSESAQRSIEAMLDELAAGAPEDYTRVPVKPRWARFAVPVGIAATLAGLIALVPQKTALTPPLAMQRPTVAVGSGLELLGESDRIEAMSDEGWVADPDGAAMQAVRVRVIEANTLRDKDTGIVVQVSDPRDEMIFTPVTMF